jgi:hypothetical protein
VDTNPIAEQLAAHISELHGPGIITGWVAVVEWCDHDGRMSAITVQDDFSPPWRLEGLMTAVADFYAEADDVEEDD